jgi:nucleoside-diphosphate-sugar epimerase
MKESSLDPLAEFRRVNVAGTLNLARQASKSGVSRFIFISSIKVNGEYTNLGHPFSSVEASFPIDPYAVSKYEAEMELRAISRETGMEVVIIRPPLIYGPRVQANFESMMNWLQRGIPLPFGGITKNRRSFVFLHNLVDLIITCINHPAAANQTFLVSDGEDLSTAELLQRMYLALGLPVRLFSVPPACITLGARLIGRGDISSRLCCSLQIDMKKTMDLLGWFPPVSVDEGLRQTAVHFLKARS